MRPLVCFICVLFPVVVAPLGHTSGADDVLTEKPMLIGAHRGGKNLWPENTIVAFQGVAERWPDALLELDVHITADGSVVVIHDDSVDRTTDGTGFVNRLTLEQIQTFDAAYRFTGDGGETFPYRGQGIRIPTLEEVLLCAPNHRFLIEIKAGRDAARLTADAIRAVDATERCIVASTRPAFIRELRDMAPEIATSYDFISASTMIQALRSGDWDAHTPAHRMLALSPDLKRRFALIPEEIQRIRDKGVLVAFFTVNRVEEMQRLLDIGVDSIITDCPDVLAALLETR